MGFINIFEVILQILIYFFLEILEWDFEENRNSRPYLFLVWKDPAHVSYAGNALKRSNILYILLLIRTQFGCSGIFEQVLQFDLMHAIFSNFCCSIDSFVIVLLCLLYSLPDFRLYLPGSECNCNTVHLLFSRSWTLQNFVRWEHLYFLLNSIPALNLEIRTKWYLYYSFLAMEISNGTWQVFLSPTNIFVLCIV